jgi:hypothetical protein
MTMGAWISAESVVKPFAATERFPNILVAKGKPLLIA